MDAYTFDLARAKKAMRDLHITQKTLASTLSLTQSAVSNIFSGKRQLKAHEARALEELLALKEPQRWRQIALIAAKDAERWREAAAASEEFIIVPLDWVPRTGFGVIIEDDSFDMAVPCGGTAAINPDHRDLFEGKIYLVKVADDLYALRIYHSNPARLEGWTRSENQPVPIILGSTPVSVIGEMTGSLLNSETIRQKWID